MLPAVVDLILRLLLFVSAELRNVQLLSHQKDVKFQSCFFYWMVKPYLLWDLRCPLFASIVYVISAPASPLLGFMVDKTGRNVIWVMIAVVTTLAAHMMLAFTFWNPWIAMVTQPFFLTHPVPSCTLHLFEK